MLSTLIDHMNLSPVHMHAVFSPTSELKLIPLETVCQTYVSHIASSFLLLSWHYLSHSLNVNFPHYISQCPKWHPFLICLSTLCLLQWNLSSKGAGNFPICSLLSVQCPTVLSIKWELNQRLLSEYMNEGNSTFSHSAPPSKKKLILSSFFNCTCTHSWGLGLNNVSIRKLFLTHKPKLVCPFVCYDNHSGASTS